MSQRLAFIRPSLAVPGKAPPKGDQWVHEAKWDGFRIQVVKAGNDVRLYSKSGPEWMKRLPSIYALPEGLRTGSTEWWAFNGLLRSRRLRRPLNTRCALRLESMSRTNGLPGTPRQAFACPALSARLGGPRLLR